MDILVAELLSPSDESKLPLLRQQIDNVDAQLAVLLPALNLDDKDRVHLAISGSIDAPGASIHLTCPRVVVEVGALVKTRNIFTAVPLVEERSAEGQSFSKNPVAPNISIPSRSDSSEDGAVVLGRKVSLTSFELLPEAQIRCFGKSLIAADTIELCELSEFVSFDSGELLAHDALTIGGKLNVSNHYLGSLGSLDITSSAKVACGNLFIRCATGEVSGELNVDIASPPVRTFISSWQLFSRTNRVVLEGHQSGLDQRSHELLPPI